MRKSKLMLEKEAKFGKPIDVLLSDLYRDKGTLRGVAEALDVNPTTIWLWMLKFNLPVKRQEWVFPSDDSQDHQAK